MVANIAGNVGRFCAGGEIAHHLSSPKGQFIDKSSLFTLLLNVIRHAAIAADICKNLMVEASATLAKNRC